MIDKYYGAAKALNKIIDDADINICGLELGTCDVADAGAGMSRIEKLCFALSQKSGWWDGQSPPVIDKQLIGMKLALIHSEVSEALEGVRKGLADTHLPHRPMVEVELADTVIRIFDLAGAMGLDVTGAIIEKLAYNQQREDHKRENRAKPGGKAI